MLRRQLRFGCQHVRFFAKYSTDSWKTRTVIHKEVSEALLKNKPVVALESTIITHGMPFPQNLKYVHVCKLTYRKRYVVKLKLSLLVVVAFEITCLLHTPDQ